MKKVIENTAYWVGILTLGIVVGVTIKVVGAWVEPNQMPPGGNIAAPLNTGNIGQAKVGGLTLNIGGSTYGLIVDKGLVGIGVTAPGEKLEVNGNIKLTGDTSGNPLYKITGVIAPTGSSDVATKGYVDTAAGGSYSGPAEFYGYHTDDPTKYDSTKEVFVNLTGSPLNLGIYMEKNDRGSDTFSNAWFKCIADGKRLPNFMELRKSCGVTGSNFNDLSVNYIASTEPTAEYHYSESSCSRSGMYGAYVLLANCNPSNPVPQYMNAPGYGCGGYYDESANFRCVH
ncbi:MAG: hypothetical protein V1690_00880 [Candidatus Moraniibacteriota bacterium]